MDRLECYYRWLTMRVWVRFDGRGYEVEAEHADGSSSVRYCQSRDDAKAYVDAEPARVGHGAGKDEGA